MNSNGVNEKIEKQEPRAINFSEIWHAFVSHILWEVLIFVVILALGFAVSTTAKDSYTATTRVIVKAYVNETEQALPENIQISQQLAPEVAKLVGDSEINEYIKNAFNCDTSGAYITASLSDDGSTSMQIIISYTHTIKAKAEEGIKAYVTAFDSYLSEEEPFAGMVEKLSLQSAVPTFGVVSPSITVDSSKNKIILLSGVVAIVGVVAFLAIAMLVGDKVNNVAKLEAITGKKNFASIGKIRSFNKTSVAEKNKPSFTRIKLNKLADTLIFMQDGDENKVIQIQSTFDGEGKTTITCNLAKALWKSQRKVLILDCDFVNPTIHKLFGLSGEQGIIDYAKKTASFEDIIKNTKYNGVDLITSGGFIPNHTVMFKSTAFSNLLEEAKNKYDFVLIDCLPVMVASDFLSVSQISDATLLVVESDRVKTKELTAVVSELTVCGANVIGTVLNYSKQTNAK